MVKRARISFENYDDFRLNITKWYTNEYRKKYIMCVREFMNKEPLSVKQVK